MKGVLKKNISAARKKLGGTFSEEHRPYGLLQVVWLVSIVMILLGAYPVQAQRFDLLLDGGHVIDPKNGIDQPMDLAIAGDSIAEVSADIPSEAAERVLDVSGMYVTPGLIDIHAHVFAGGMPGRFAGGSSSVPPDAFSFRSGVTTIVDAGDSGWRNFPEFKQSVIDPSQTRVLAFLNIAGYGLRDSTHNHSLEDMNPQITASLVERYRDIIVGVKIGHFQADDWTPFERAMEVGQITNSPLLLECHLPELPLSELLKRMRPGDIFTHAFGQVNDRTSILDGQDNVRPYVRKAKDEGIVFDVGHGGGSFHYSQAIPAMQQGLIPDTFGTDLHRYSMNDGMKDMLNIMSKYLNMGLNIQQLIERGSWNGAKAIKRPDLGHLSEGAVADVAVLDIQQGKFGFVDSGGYKISGDRKLEAELTIRAGNIVWDLNGISATTWN